MNGSYSLTLPVGGNGSKHSSALMFPRLTEGFDGGVVSSLMLLNRFSNGAASHGPGLGFNACGLRNWGRKKQEQTAQTMLTQRRLRDGTKHWTAVCRMASDQACLRTSRGYEGAGWGVESPPEPAAARHCLSVTHSQWMMKPAVKPPMRYQLMVKYQLMSPPQRLTGVALRLAHPNC
jgi:hypothetical protein